MGAAGIHRAECWLKGRVHGNLAMSTFWGQHLTLHSWLAIRARPDGRSQGADSFLGKVGKEAINGKTLVGSACWLRLLKD